jgi:hypothetical protein
MFVVPLDIACDLLCFYKQLAATSLPVRPGGEMLGKTLGKVSIQRGKYSTERISKSICNAT